MLEEGFDITLYSIKGEGCDRLLLAELSIFLIETKGKVSPMCLCNDIVDILDGQHSFGPPLTPAAGQSIATDC